jgi:hypothetical protein
MPDISLNAHAPVAAAATAARRSALTLIVMRPVLTALLAAIALPAAAAAPDSLVPDLERRLAVNGVEKVNAYLTSRWTSAMVPLNRKVATCEDRAVSLAVRLSRSKDAKAAQAHGDSIREAVGNCTTLVLALATPDEIPKYCSSVASWGVMQTVRELRRRIAAIDSDELLRSTARGKSCRAAYVNELQNTRVVLKSAPR